MVVFSLVVYVYFCDITCVFYKICTLDLIQDFKNTLNFGGVPLIKKYMTKVGTSFLHVSLGECLKVIAVEHVCGVELTKQKWVVLNSTGQNPQWRTLWSTALVMGSILLPLCLCACVGHGQMGKPTPGSLHFASRGYFCLLFSFCSSSLLILRNHSFAAVTLTVFRTALLLATNICSLQKRETAIFFCTELLWTIWSLDSHFNFLPIWGWRSSSLSARPPAPASVTWCRLTCRSVNLLCFLWKPFSSIVIIQGGNSS